MADLKKYYARIRRAIETLPPGDYFFLASIDNEDLGPNAVAGSITEVNKENAARNIAAGTHRLATPAEVEAFHVTQEEIRRKTAQAEFDKRQPIAITVHTTQDGKLEAKAGPGKAPAAPTKPEPSK